MSIYSYLCETCDDYVTNANAEVIIEHEGKTLLSESVFGDSHYQRIDWHSFYQPVLKFFDVKVITTDEVVNDYPMVLRIQSGDEYSAEYSLVLEIDQKVVLALQVNDEDYLPELMKEIFSKITENCKFTIERVINSSSYGDDDIEDENEAD